MKLNNFVEDNDLQGTDIIHFSRTEMIRNRYKLGQIITIGLMSPSPKGLILTIGWNPDLVIGAKLGHGGEIQSHVSPFYHKRLLQIFGTAENIGTEPEINFYDAAEQIDNSSILSPSHLLIKLCEQMNEEDVIPFMENAVNAITDWISAKKIINFNAAYAFKSFQFVLISEAYWGCLNRSSLSNIPVLFLVDFENWNETIKQYYSLNEQILQDIKETQKNKHNISTLFQSILDKLTRVEMVSEAILWKKIAHFSRLISRAPENAVHIQNMLLRYNNSWLELKNNNTYSDCFWCGQDRTREDVKKFIGNHNKLKPPPQPPVPGNIPSFANEDREIREKESELERYKKEYENLNKRYASLTLNDNVPLNEIDLIFEKPKFVNETCLEKQITIYEKLTREFKELMDSIDKLIVELESLLGKSAEWHRQIHAFDKTVVEDNMEGTGQWIDTLLSSVDSEIPWYKWLLIIKFHYDSLYKLMFESYMQNNDQLSNEIEHESKQLIAWIQLLDANISNQSVEGLFSFELL